MSLKIRSSRPGAMRFDRYSLTKLHHESAFHPIWHINPELLYPGHEPIWKSPSTSPPY